MRTDGEFTALSSLVPGIFSFAHEGLSSGTEYTYRIEILDGDSPIASAEAHARPQPCAPVPSLVSAPLTLTADGSPWCVSAGGAPLNTVTSSIVIEPGTVVLFEEAAGWSFDAGGLVSNGTENSPVVLTSRDPSPTVWGGLFFSSASRTARYDQTLDGLDYVEGNRLAFTFVDHSGGITSEGGLDIEGSVFRFAFKGAGDGGALNLTAAADRNLYIRDSIFAQNSCFDDRCEGGALWLTLSGRGRLLMERNAWLFNQAARAGAARLIIRTDSDQPRAIERGSLYFGNQGLDVGGAFYDGTGIVELESNSYIDNQALGDLDGRAGAGGLAVINDSPGTLRGLVFERNQAGTEGGAVFLSQTHLVTDSVFLENSANNGGAIWSVGRAQVERSRFRGNVARSVGGAIGGREWQALLCTFENNRADRGGAIGVDGWASSVDRCVISGNQATSDGGGVLILASDDPVEARITATHLLDNIADNGANLTNRECDGVIPVTGVFWDGPVSGVVNDCSSDGLAVSGSATEPYALCTDAPSDPDCVGALIQVR